MTRVTLEPRRFSLNFTLAFQGERYHVTTGFYGDGRTGEIFINRIRNKTAARLGEPLDAICRDSAILMSLAIQHGADLAALKHSITRDEEGQPMSIVGAILDAVEIGGQPSEPEALPPQPSPQGRGSAAAQADEGVPCC